MPGLVVFNRRWMVASDELVIPFGLAVITRSAWFVAVGVIFMLHHFLENHDNVPSYCNENLLHYYFVGYLVFLFLSTVNDAIVAIVSGRGSIFDKHSRKNLPKYLYIRAFMLVLEAVIGSYGSYVAYDDQQKCLTGYSQVLFKLVTLFNLIWVFGCLVIIWFTFDSAGNIWYALERRSVNKKTPKKYRSIDTLDFENKITEKNQKYWQRTCKLMFCCIKTENARDNVLLFASKLFTNYFRACHDIVPSDILAGMILLRQKQKFEEYKRVEKELENSASSYQQVTYHKGYKSVRRHQKTSNAFPFEKDNKEDMRILDEVTYFAGYAQASYGWPMYCFLNNFPICKKEGCRLMGRVRCCFCCCCLCGDRANVPTVKGDNCCLCNLAAQKATLDINDDNFIYVSYEVKVFKTPFSVIVDKAKRSIVIACRGTLSLQDILTDLAIDEVQLPGYEEGWTAHRGFFEAATEIKKIIEENQLIEKAREFDVDKGSRDFKIVLVGHSLGAGTATILAFLLKSKYPDLVCFAYGPPGASLSYEASCYARDFIYSVVLGKDLVSRMNLHTLNELMYNVLQMLKATNLPKWKILKGCMCQCVLCCTHSNERSFHEYFESEEEIKFEPYNNPNIRKLYMGGKVVHICKIKSIYPRFGKKKAVYKGYWSTPEDFQSILVSNLMLYDHYPDALIGALSSILHEDVEEEMNGALGEREDTLIDNGSASINILAETGIETRNYGDTIISIPKEKSGNGDSETSQLLVDNRETMIVKDAAKSTLPTVQIRRGDNESTPLVGDDPVSPTILG